MPRKPKVRAVTAFIRIDREHYGRQIAEALSMLRQAKAGFEEGGYEVQTIRITTQPFPQYTQGMSRADALQLFKALDALSAREVFSLNIGPALQNDSDAPAQAELLGQILADTSVNASVIVAAADGIHWNSVRAAAQVMKYLEENSPRGEKNFGLAATAMLPPTRPSIPGHTTMDRAGSFLLAWKRGISSRTYLKLRAARRPLPLFCRKN